MTVIACLLLPAEKAAAQTGPTSTSQPATTPARATTFQPGVTIDWSKPAVRVDGRVVLRSGPLEFLACFPGKEHESIVLLEASAAHVYMALGLIGLAPGRPPVWDEQTGTYQRPTGDLVNVAFEWEHDGKTVRADAHAWLREIEYGRSPLPRPWVFAGSRVLDDDTLLADRSGAGVALVSFADCLLALSRGHSSHDAELWAVANTPAIPDEHTPVKLVLRPARPRRYELRIDFRGDAYANDRFVTPQDLVDLLWLARQFRPNQAQTISVDGALRSDVTRLQRALTAAGIEPHALRFVRSEPPATRPAQPTGAQP